MIKLHLLFYILLYLIHTIATLYPISATESIKGITIDEADVPNDKDEKPTANHFDFILILSLRSDLFLYNTNNLFKFFSSFNFSL